jgi:hypothetical protein
MARVQKPAPAFKTTAVIDEEFKDVSLGRGRGRGSNLGCGEEQLVCDDVERNIKIDTRLDKDARPVINRNSN